VRAVGVHEARSGGAEHEVEQLAAGAAHSYAPPVVVDGDDNGGLGGAAEVGDSRVRAYARDGSRGMKHESRC
jgi:hypothetical protein